MNEDFVSFELAKKLKEKGFSEKCLAYYDAEDNVGLLYNTQYSDELLPCQYTDLLASYNSGDIAANLDTSDNCIDAPTISQVLKWLGKEKKIHIGIVLTPMDLYKPVIGICKSFGNNIDSISPRCFPEEAALSGIEYCLNNLI